MQPPMHSLLKLTWVILGCQIQTHLARMTEHTDAVWDPARPFQGWYCVFNQGWLIAEWSAWWMHLKSQVPDPKIQPSHGHIEHTAKVSCFQVTSEDYLIMLSSQLGYANQFYDTTWTCIASSLTMFTSFWKKWIFLVFESNPMSKKYT